MSFGTFDSDSKNSYVHSIASTIVTDTDGTSKTIANLAYLKVGDNGINNQHIPGALLQSGTNRHFFTDSSVVEMRNTNQISNIALQIFPQELAVVKNYTNDLLKITDQQMEINLPINMKNKKIINMADGNNDQDCVTVKQLNTALQQQQQNNQAALLQSFVIPSDPLLNYTAPITGNQVYSLIFKQVMTNNSSDLQYNNSTGLWTIQPGFYSLSMNFIFTQTLVNTNNTQIHFKAQSGNNIDQLVSQSLGGLTSTILGDVKNEFKFQTFFRVISESTYLLQAQIYSSSKPLLTSGTLQILPASNINCVKLSV